MNFPQIIFYESVQEDCSCTCHRFAPGVDPPDNQGNMSGNTGG